MTTVTDMTESERRKQRALKFGTHNEDLEREKRKERASRFGTENKDLETEKKKARALRFGTHNPDLEAEKKAARKERFGIQTEAEKKLDREKRFGKIFANGNVDKMDMPLTAEKRKPSSLDEDEAKRQKRAERFGLPTTSSEAEKLAARKERFAQK